MRRHSILVSNLVSKRFFSEKNSAGFSLVELMVSVGIIGILASVAIPQYSKFTNRAKQSEARVKLGSLYTIEKAFYVEANKFSSCLANIGFIPESTPTTRYMVGFNTLTANSNNVGSVNCSGTLAAGTHFFEANNTAVPGAAGKTIKVTSSVDTTFQTFTAVAEGYLQPGTWDDGKTDQWSITETQTLKNERAGL
ncbi:MAG: prepilin-type N-terminal cleavage/methylation domain-containing protein [Bdellovibrionales bacterium]|nr:prepilin-type N-terminal cleavage/methylation domain-containing protein [Bdellovibrionales bacterium]